MAQFWNLGSITPLTQAAQRKSPANLSQTNSSRAAARLRLLDHRLDCFSLEEVMPTAGRFRGSK
jgi:hypothetical protein